jgi:hypothetical protein
VRNPVRALRRRILPVLGRNPYVRGVSADPSIEVLIRGGLGNQLFGYAAGLELSRLNSAPLHLVTQLLEESTENKREFALEEILVPGVTWGTASSAKKIHKEDGFSYFEGFLDISPSTILDGYFQSPKYFSKSEVELVSTIKRSVSFAEGRESVSKIPFLAVQVRRGDYLLPKNRSVHGVMPDSYFVAGVQQLRNRVGSLPAIVFSDSLDAAARISLLVPECTPSPTNANDNLWFQLGALSSAKGLCISNSTFGWWGAFLADSSPPTIAPGRWFVDKSIETSDLFPSKWVLQF